MKILIPVEPHVFEFLTSSEMYGAELPLKARKDNLLGQMVIMLASKGTIEFADCYHERLLPVIPEKLIMLPVETTYPLREEMIREENLMCAGQMLSMMFEMQVVFYTLGYMARQGSERGGISKMYQQFGLVDDPNKQEALRGMTKRFRKSVMVNNQKAAAKKPSRSAQKVSSYAELLSQKLKSCPTPELTSK